MANIIGEPLSFYVSDQINARQILHGKGAAKSKGINYDPLELKNLQRTDKHLSTLISNTSWVKLSSGVKLIGEEGKKRLKDIGFLDDEIDNFNEDNLAKKFILYGGTAEIENNKIKSKQGFLENYDPNSSYLYSYTPVTSKDGTQIKGADFGYSPMPGIISAEIKSLNRGSLEKAFIKIKANDRRQLDILDILYMRLGYTVLLEWGNSIYTSDGEDRKKISTTLLEDKFFQVGSSTSYFDFLGPGGIQLIEQYRKKYDGNYDGMLAVISNFSWTFNPDGSYDIDLTLISMGDVVESLKSNISVDYSAKKIISNVTTTPGSPIEEKKDKNLINFMLWSWKQTGSNGNPVSIKFEKSLSKDIIGAFLYPGEDKNSISEGTFKFGFSFRIGGNKEEIKTFKSADPIAEADDYLISRCSSDPLYEGITRIDPKNTTASTKPPKQRTDDLYPDDPLNKPWSLGGWELLNDLNTKEISNPNKNATNLDACLIESRGGTIPEYYLRFGYLLQFLQERIIPVIKSTKKNPPIISIDYSSKGNYMYAIGNQISFDPRVCIIRNKAIQTIDGIAEVFSELPAYFKGKNVGNIMNIYLNFNKIIEILDSNANERGDVNIFLFINSLCKEINKALGGVNNLEPIIDSKNNRLKIIDGTPIPGVSCPSNNDYQLNLFGYNKLKEENWKYKKSGEEIIEYSSTFVRKLDLKTNITPEYATMVTIGATANGYVKGTEATAFSNWNKGIEDRFKKEIITPISESTVTEAKKYNVDEAEYNYVVEWLSPDKKLERLGYTNDIFSPILGVEINNDIIERNLSIVTEFYKYRLAEKGLKTQQAGTIGFIPFKLGITMDGISGIKIYNKLEVNSKFLPTRYGDTLNFIIVGVNQKLINNDWETHLDTIVMPKTSEFTGLDIIKTEYKKIQPPTPTPTPSSACDPNLSTRGISTTDPLVPGAYETSQINSLAKNLKVKDSNDEYEKQLREYALQLAFSYVGQKEIYNDEGFCDSKFENQIKRVGWQQNQAWCGYFAKLIWSYTFGPSILNASYPTPPVITQIQSPRYLKNQISARLIWSPATPNWKTNSKKHSSYLDAENIKNSPGFIPYSGDVACFKRSPGGNISHVEIITNCSIDQNGSITIFTIGGNFNKKVSYTTGKLNAEFYSSSHGLYLDGIARIPLNK